jgi:hypothetical protein
MEVSMLCGANSPATTLDSQFSTFAPRLRWKHVAFAAVLSFAISCLPPKSYAAGLDCPEIGTRGIPNLFADLEIKLLGTENSVDLANEINDAINKLQIAQPNISYAEMTNVILAGYCQVIANKVGITALEKWSRMRQFDAMLQRQLAANVEPAGTLIVANIPLLARSLS